MEDRQKSETVFKEFLELVSKLTFDGKEVCSMLQKTYDQTNPHFRWSRGFINLLTLCSDEIHKTPERHLLHISKLICELSKYKAKPLKHMLGSALHISESNDSLLEDMPLAKRPNIERNSLTEQIKTFSKGKKGDNFQLITGNEAAAKKEEKRKNEDGFGEILSVSEGSNDSNNSETQRKECWLHNSSTVKKSGSSLPLRVKNMKNVTQSIVKKVCDSDVICLDDEDEDDNIAQKMGQKNDDDVEPDFESEAEMTAYDLNFPLDESGPQLRCLNKFQINKPRTINEPKNSHFDTSKVPQNDIEVICLDDDDDDKVEEAGKGSEKNDSNSEDSLLTRLYSLKKLMRNSVALPVSSVTDLGVVEIIDTDENAHENEIIEVQNIPAKSQLTVRDEESDNVKICQQTVNVINYVTAPESVEDMVENAAVTAVDETSEREIKAVDEFVNTTDRNKSEALSSDGDDDDDDDGDDDEANEESEDEEVVKQINQLGRILRRLGKEIQRLELTEMTLDDMNSEESAFIKESELRSKFIECWTVLCDVTHTKFTGRACDKRFEMEIPDYPELGRKISKLINEDKVFPDFQDIHEIVVSQSINSSLSLIESDVQNLSKKIFTSVGSKIQQQRKAKLFELMKLYLPANLRSYDDPATFDRDLCQKLEENRSLGRAKLDSVFMAYAEKQNAEGGEEEISDDDEDEDESCDDDDGDSESADKFQILQSDSCLEHSLEIMKESSVGKPSASEVVTPTNDTESLMKKYQADDSFSEADHDEFDEEESVKMSNSDGDYDVLVITFDGSKTNDCSGREASVVSNDNQTASESSITNKLQDAVGSAKGIKMMVNSQLQIQSDLLANIRRLTSKISFHSNSALFGAVESKDSGVKTGQNSLFEGCSATDDPLKLLEVEIDDSDGSTMSSLLFPETLLKKSDLNCSGDSGDEGREVMDDDKIEKVSNTDTLERAENVSNILEVEQYDNEIVSPREPATKITNTIKTFTENLSTAIPSKLEVKTQTVVSDKTVKKFITIPCDKLQIEPGNLPRSAANVTFSTDELHLEMSPDIFSVEDDAILEQLTSPSYLYVRGSVDRESPILLVDDEVRQPASDVTCANVSSNPSPLLDNATSSLHTSFSSTICDIPVDICLSSDSKLQLEASENARASNVSCNFGLSNKVDNAGNICSSSPDLNLQLESSIKDDEASAAPSILSSVKCKVAEDAKNNEKMSSLLEKLREVCSKKRHANSLGSRRTDVELSIIIIDE